MYFNRFLATGDTFGTIAFSYRQGHKTVRRIVYETCDAIWKRLSPLYLSPPNKEKWKKIEQEFRTRWNYPNCVGSVDGKHVVINKPYHSGSLYFNYKKFCSIVLMAVVDAEYKFTMIDVGGYGKNSDSSIFANCNFGKRLKEGQLDFPEDAPLPGTEEPMPHVIVGDEAFPLQKNLMRPYPGNELTNNEDKKIFNLRLSRARNTSEDAFGILSKRFGVYQRRLEVKPKYVNKIVLATCVLHNFLKTNSMTILSEVMEDDAATSSPQNSAFHNLMHVGGSFAGISYLTREKFKNYFSSSNGSVEWQVRAVQ
ncbi:protein ALP1-like [Aphis craccivora]|uniref:Protein ALP1-like n=1 Tax=Aphis craccivora TaxID=307492 RepID=A0A6G0VYB1_APHCR|nr:protein ALP1-like [Aphis craccivora]